MGQDHTPSLPKDGIDKYAEQLDTLHVQHHVYGLLPKNIENMLEYNDSGGPIKD